MKHEYCDKCGFDGTQYDDRALLGALRGLGPRWGALLTLAGTDLRVRPEPEVWSAIEYAAHSRDVTALHIFGVQQALSRDEPVFPPIGDDLVDAAAADYGDADVDEVAAELAVQAPLLAQVAEAAGTAEWSRGITTGDSRSDVRYLLEHALHDSLHHLEDVERGLTRLSE
jgi:hypothetical protein